MTIESLIIFNFIAQVVPCEMKNIALNLQAAQTNLNGTNMSSTNVNQEMCEKEGLGVFLLGSYLYCVFALRFLCEGMGFADWNELLTFTKASRVVNRLFFGIILAAPFVFFLSFVGTFDISSLLFQCLFILFM